MICFDTSIVIWGVQGTAGSAQGEMIRRTKRYIEHLAEKGEKVMIPAPALAEYLVHFDPADQRKQRQAVEKNFLVPAFDVHAAALAAELLGNTELLKEIIKTGDVDRIKVKTDAEIIATAIVNGAEKIISHDPDFAKLAQGKIKVEEVPHIQAQMGFF